MDNLTDLKISFADLLEFADAVSLYRGIDLDLEDTEQVKKIIALLKKFDFYMAVNNVDDIL